MSLQEVIRHIIEEKGAISVAEYMQLCLLHPEYGYYTQRDPLGAAGDFTTSPEISQIFGELLGLWLAAQWQKQGSKKALLVELGPGRGTLMADILRATKRVKHFHDAIEVVLVEASPVLKQKQWQALAGKHDRVSWVESLSELPEKEPLFLIANEFFDALPVHQYAGGKERMITLGDDGALQFTGGEEDVTEASPYSLEVVAEIASHIAVNGGAGLIIDYGYVGGSQGDTLQAMKKHQYHPVLEDCGEADITAHVDFDALKATASEAGAHCFGVMPQGKFLLQIGASQRLMKLCSNASETQRQELMSGFERLIAPDQMGDLFKILALLPYQADRPEGF